MLDLLLVVMVSSHRHKHGLNNRPHGFRRQGRLAVDGMDPADNLVDDHIHG
jgi:hypothetical protein